MTRQSPRHGPVLLFDLVIFDCDGVLIDSEIISARMLVQELALLGVQIDLAYVDPATFWAAAIRW
jgi:beta-phosphoglucomutase-like phosphatase (HAD superfamily)